MRQSYRLEPELLEIELTESALLPLALKIDRAFVRGCADDPRDAAIVTSLLNPARGLGLRTVAEGVETEAQVDFLRRHGCDELQGFCFARPKSAGSFRRD